MHLKVRAALLALVLLFGGNTLLCRAQVGDPDESELMQLKRAGIDLSKPHRIRFRLIFPKEIVDEAVLRLHEAGLDARRWVAEPQETLVVVTRDMVPELATLQKLRSDFNSIVAATRLEGTEGVYAGWGVKPLFRSEGQIDAQSLWVKGNKILLFASVPGDCYEDFGSPPPGNAQLFVSNDAGRTWRRRGPQLDGYEFEFVYEKDGRIWIAGEHTMEGPSENPFIFVPGEGEDKWEMRTIYRDNAGIDRMGWTADGELLAWILYFDLNDLAPGPPYIHHSTDGGRTWKILGLASRHPMTIAAQFKTISPDMDPLWRAVSLPNGGVVQHRDREDEPWKTVARFPEPRQCAR